MSNNTKYIDSEKKIKELEFKLEQALKKAKEADNLKAAFIANMSHQIRTPLNSIVGFASLLADKSYDNDEERAEYAEIINKNTISLLGMVQDMIYLSAYDSGNIHLDITEINFSLFLEEFCQTARIEFLKPNLELKIINPYKKCIINSDKDKLHKVMINYFTNANKYTYNGSITIRYSCINNGIKVEFIDTGIGIKDEMKDKVFLHFQKFNPSDMDGYGLGLALCKAVIESLQGKVGFESVHGQGSNFWFWIPCEPKIS
ncbi:MAG: HAMP domain-containing sensor histidine kinase [Bacteroidales bacterium]